ncbi:MAG TPA: winged helix-turn-helix domain-containing protein [Paraburkholderia sp.]|uniref:winged helix-turn-helix domain-containing protein n=1 Tax=Paraburkholderia sp. TaxID=1926495 RepID=UPI002CB29D3A|nr:winged helix-turn-helix domain-containing protein [Paraburkholderia sp.]HTR10692.1 winged helix-turn-helix domain-containing protein [Paraburkholderia sp.]
MTRPADTYLRFLQLIEAQPGPPELAPLDPLEKKILEVVARAFQNKDRLSVKDMMGHSELGSPATLHTRVASMCAKGWIALNDTEDVRRKQIDLTSEALLYFEKLSESVLQAMKPASSHSF